MTEPHKPHKAGHTGLVNADPGHAPGKQHIEADEIRTATHGDPKQYERSMPVAEPAGRKPRMRRGR